MTIPLGLQVLSIAGESLEIYVPDSSGVRHRYKDDPEAAYWAQVWPAAIGLCLFLQKHPHYIERKDVLELAAGLGLPGLYAAGIAGKVCITDRSEEATACVMRSIEHLRLSSVVSMTMDWTASCDAPLPDVVLLSDVNYDPSLFDELHQALVYFLEKKVTVIISTPQRLIAKQFMVRLLSYCVLQWSSDVLLRGRETGVSVWVLQADRC